MTLRKQWIQTKTWVRMVAEMYYFRKPLKLPDSGLSQPVVVILSQLRRAICVRRLCDFQL